MFCSKCGSKIEDGCAFCTQCGAKVENSSAPVADNVQKVAETEVKATPTAESVQKVKPVKKEKVKKQKGSANNKNKIIGIAVAVIAVAVVIGLAFFVKGLFGGSNSVSKYAELNYKLSPYVLYNGKIVEDYKGTSNQYAFGTSLSGDCIITSDDYCIKDRKAYELEGVISHHVAVAASGNGVAYCTRGGAVMLLDPNTGKTTTIEKKGDFAGVAISPDGETVLYTDGDTAYIYNKGESTNIFEAEDGVIMVGAVSDGAKHIFIDEKVYDTNTLYCLDKDGDEIEKFKNVSYVKYTNADNTQIAFFNGYRGVGDEMIVYDATTEDEIKIDFDDSDDNILRALIPIAHKYSAVSAAISAHYGNAVGVKNLFASGVTAFDTDNLLECYYHFGDYTGAIAEFGHIGYGYGYYNTGLGIYGIEDQEFENVAEDIYNYALLSNGDFVYIDANEKLVLYKDGDKETIDRDVRGFVDSYDGKSIYYLTNDNELYRYKNGKSKEIAEDVSNVMVVGNDIVVFNVEDNGSNKSDEIEQYIYDNGRVKKANKDIWYEIGYYINSIDRTNYLPLYDEDDLYILYGSGKTERIEIPEDKEEDEGLIELGIVGFDSDTDLISALVNRDMMELFTEENGYAISYSYSLSVDEQKSAARAYIDEGVDYLIINPFVYMDDWDDIFHYAAGAGVKVIFSDSRRDKTGAPYFANIYYDTLLYDNVVVDWLKKQNLSEYKVLWLSYYKTEEYTEQGGAFDYAAEIYGWTVNKTEMYYNDVDVAYYTVLDMISTGINVIYAENYEFAQKAAEALDYAGVSYGVGKDVTIIVADGYKPAMEEVLNKNWNYTLHGNPFWAKDIHEVIQQFEKDGYIENKDIMIDICEYDAATITQEDIDKYVVE